MVLEWNSKSQAYKFLSVCGKGITFDFEGVTAALGSRNGTLSFSTHPVCLLFWGTVGAGKDQVHQTCLRGCQSFGTLVGESIPGPKCSLTLSASCLIPISRPYSITWIKPSPAECPWVHRVSPVSKEWDPEPVTQGLIGVDHGITKMTTITRGLSLQNVTKS